MRVKKFAKIIVRSEDKGDNCNSRLSEKMSFQRFLESAVVKVKLMHHAFVDSEWKTFTMQGV